MYDHLKNKTDIFQKVDIYLFINNCMSMFKNMLVDIVLFNGICNYILST
jgi:hypothetical protein